MHTSHSGVARRVERCVLQVMTKKMTSLTLRLAIHPAAANITDDSEAFV